MRASGASYQEIAYALGASSRESGRKAYHLARSRRDVVDFVTPTALRDGSTPAVDEEHLAAWAAGFFDGEGCISARCESRDGHLKTSLLVVISQTIPEPLLAIQRRWGGGIRDVQPGEEAWQHQWTWRIHGRAAAPFLRDIQPYLLVKREHADLALKFIALVGTRGQKVADETHDKRMLYIEAIQRLNSRRHTRRPGSGRVA